jgi:hypothetical protein
VALVLRAGIVSGLKWCALALAPQARAATFAELPFAAQPGVATCLRATGEPGELIRFGPLTRTSSAIDVQRVGEAGAQRIQRIAFGQLLDCPAAAAAGGAGVIAGPVRTGRRTGEMQVSLREPGDAFGAPPASARRASTSGSPRRRSRPPVPRSSYGRSGAPSDRPCPSTWTGRRCASSPHCAPPAAPSARRWR